MEEQDPNTRKIEKTYSYTENQSGTKVCEMGTKRKKIDEVSKGDSKIIYLARYFERNQIDECNRVSSLLQEL
ncbi:hypothetical protein EHO62_18750 [Leptospira kmetyi]|uniref:Transposase n=1 Tax=Leptospira kmetyi TaxID=408139 RepID=A0ABX4N3W2_9LEPT|nr:hypothetical protein CH378_20045 [Leptospira kmetyi]TGK12960.1 hypothetical protein EHO62_18750 [Leptospira kmetyi]TGK34720.1 hypothetical protein EHO66_00290 [Leptospira kmetyi]